jgi:hypothetical protein
MATIVQLRSSTEERALRSGEFSLLPDIIALPRIMSQPANNFVQYTWIENVINGIPNYQNIKIKDNTITILSGTEFSIGIRSVDLSNVANINDTANLSYKWKRDDSYIYELNSLNNGIGSETFMVLQNNSVTTLSGKYVCEVSNAFGTVETEPFNINVIDPLSYPKFYNNLILNGDGDGGLDGWIADQGIRTLPFSPSTGVVRSFGSMRLAGFRGLFLNYDSGESSPSEFGGDAQFFFTQDNHSFLFYNWHTWRSNLSIGTNYLNINVKQNLRDFISPLGLWDWHVFCNEGQMCQIIPNEDIFAPYIYGAQEFASFFPGIRWMDRYNKNGIESISLHSEMNNTTTNYFTRDRILFEKFGGTADVSMNQTINLSDISEFIDGEVYGVKYTTSQFFAYVGAGITGYKIRVNDIIDGIKEFNYYIGDAETVYNAVVMPIPSAIPDPEKGRYYFTSPEFVYKKYNIAKDSDIEIIPIVDDTTAIKLEYKDEFDKVLKTEYIDGPDVTDVWAIKEKVYFPLTLYGLFRFIKPNGDNPIKVFGQTYTTTEALKPLFNDSNAGLFKDGINNTAANSISDKNAKFLLNKYNFKYNNLVYPADSDGNGPYFINLAERDRRANGRSSGVDRAIDDHGAAAMFGVGRDIKIPYKTRSVKISVKFTHKSEIIKDNSPELKSWDSQEIYSYEYGQNSGIGRVLSAYGNPRCAISKIKFIVAVNDMSISEKYTSFSIPPADKSVLGLEKQKYTIADAFNNVTKPDFNYTISAQLLQNINIEPLNTTNPLIQVTDANTLQQIIESQNQIIDPSSVVIPQDESELSDLESEGYSDGAFDDQESTVIEP